MSKKQVSCQHGTSGQFELVRWLLWLWNCAFQTVCFIIVEIYDDIRVTALCVESRGAMISLSLTEPFSFPGKHHCPLCHGPPEPGEYVFHERDPSVAQVLLWEGRGAAALGKAPLHRSAPGCQERGRAAAVGLCLAARRGSRAVSTACFVREPFWYLRLSWFLLVKAQPKCNYSR